MLDLTDIDINELSYNLINQRFDALEERPTTILITPVQAKHFFRGWKLYRGVKLKEKE